MKTIVANNLHKFILSILVITAVIAPISQYIDNNYSGKEVLRAGKDLLVYVVFAAAAFHGHKHKKEQILEVFNSTVNKLTISYIGINCLYFLFSTTGLQAKAAGLLFNTRFLVWFLLVQLTVQLYSADFSKKFIKTLKAVAVLLIAVALIQIFVLPPDFFSFLGYEYSSGLSYQTVDNDPNLPRFSSLTRGPNVFGAFLVVFLSLKAVEIWSLKKQRTINSFVVLAGLITLYFTYSRSAVVGLLASIGLIFVQKSSRKQLLVSSLIFFVLLGGLMFVSSNSQRLQRVIFHDENQSQEQDSNDTRLNQLETTMQQVAEKPFGNGLGSSGPASFYGEPSIPDNYYAQIVVELGLVGLSLFLILIGAVLRQLRRLNPVVFSIGVGLCLIAFLNHIWADELVGYAWWGLAAISFSQNKNKLLLSKS